MQLHLRPFYDRLKDGQHKVYEWSRTLNVTVDMKAEHLFKNMDRKTLAIMTRLAGDDWEATGSAVVPLLVQSGEFTQARELQRQVSIR